MFSKIFLVYLDNKFRKNIKLNMNTDAVPCIVNCVLLDLEVCLVANRLEYYFISQ